MSHPSIPLPAGAGTRDAVTAGLFRLGMMASTSGARIVEELGYAVGHLLVSVNHSPDPGAELDAWVAAARSAGAEVTAWERAEHRGARVVFGPVVVGVYATVEKLAGWALPVEGGEVR